MNFLSFFMENAVERAMFLKFIVFLEIELLIYMAIRLRLNKIILYSYDTKINVSKTKNVSYLYYFSFFSGTYYKFSTQSFCVVK